MSGYVIVNEDGAIGTMEADFISLVDGYVEFYVTIVKQENPKYNSLVGGYKLRDGEGVMLATNYKCI